MSDLYVISPPAVATMKANIRTPTNLLFMPFLVPLYQLPGRPLLWGGLPVCAALFLQLALLAALAKSLLLTVQMFLMLPPAPRNRAADASATNAMSRVYSIRSCPCSSFQKLRKNVIVFAPKFLSCTRSEEHTSELQSLR